MENKKQLDDLHSQSLQHLDAYINTKGALSDEDKEKINKAKNDWHDAWVKLQEIMLQLEKLEI